MELIPNWKESWRFASTLLMALIGIFDIIYANHDQFQELMTPGQFATFNTVLAAIAIFARIVRQYIPVTQEVKEKMVEHVATLPEKAE